MKKRNFLQVLGGTSLGVVFAKSIPENYKEVLPEKPEAIEPEIEFIREESLDYNLHDVLFTLEDFNLKKLYKGNPLDLTLKSFNEMLDTSSLKDGYYSSRIPLKRNTSLHLETILCRKERERIKEQMEEDRLCSFIIQQKEIVYSGEGYITAINMRISGLDQISDKIIIEISGEVIVTMS
jgi:hypothetical protein